MKVDITVTGWPKLLKTLETLPIKMKKYVYGRAAKVGGEAIQSSIQRIVPRDTGTLAMHIVSVARSYKRGEIRMAIVGPERKIRRVHTRVTGRRRWDVGSRRWVGTLWLRTVVLSPSKYAHLVNDGFYSVTAKRQIPGKHFMERGTRASAAKAQRLMEQVVTAGIMASAGRNP